MWAHRLALPNPSPHTLLPSHKTTPPHVQTGDHVRVLAGKHAGQAGLVVKVDGRQLLLVGDTSRQQIRVFGRDCTSAEAAPIGAWGVPGWRGVWKSCFWLMGAWKGGQHAGGGGAARKHALAHAMPCYTLSWHVI